MIDNEAVVEFYDKFKIYNLIEIEERPFSNPPYFGIKLLEHERTHNLYWVLYTGEAILAIIDHKAIYVTQELVLNGISPFTKEIEAFEAEYGCFVKFEYRKEKKDA